MVNCKKVRKYWRWKATIRYKNNSNTTPFLRLMTPNSPKVPPMTPTAFHVFLHLSFRVLNFQKYSLLNFWANSLYLFQNCLIKRYFHNKSKSILMQMWILPGRFLSNNRTHSRLALVENRCQNPSLTKSSWELPVRKANASTALLRASWAKNHLSVLSASDP